MDDFLALRKLIPLYLPGNEARGDCQAPGRQRLVGPARCSAQNPAQPGDFDRSLRELLRVNGKNAKKLYVGLCAEAVENNYPNKLPNTYVDLFVIASQASAHAHSPHSSIQLSIPYPTSYPLADGSVLVCIASPRYSLFTP